MKCITLAVAGTAAIFANVAIAGAATKSPDLRCALVKANVRVAAAGGNLDQRQGPD